MNGIIFDIKKFALHDGPGIRMTIFLKGCPLDCWWCHNPESIRKLPEKIDVIPITNAGKVCEQESELFGKSYSVEELFTEIRKDQLFYDESGGGVTFSGGEPLIQNEFLVEILNKCRQAEIHTAVDTSGYAGKQLFARIYEITDIFLFDLKIIDEELHRKFTGVSNKVILENLMNLTEKGNKVIVRIPLIPGVTDTEKNLSDLSAFLMTLDNIRKIDLLPYNEIAESKYKRFNKPSRLGNLKTQDEAKLNEIKSYFGDSRFEVSLRG
jgi:pyruvate formate lyase activating enzyme